MFKVNIYIYIYIYKYISASIVVILYELLKIHKEKDKP